MEENNPSSEISSTVSIWPIVGSIIIILVLIIGGLYFWGRKLQSEKNVTPANIESTQIDTQPTTSDQQAPLPVTPPVPNY